MKKIVVLSSLLALASMGVNAAQQELTRPGSSRSSSRLSGGWDEEDMIDTTQLPPVKPYSVNSTSTQTDDLLHPRQKTPRYLDEETQTPIVDPEKVLATLNDAARSAPSKYYSFSQAQDAVTTMLLTSVALNAFVNSPRYSDGIGNAITATALAGGSLMPYFMRKKRTTYLSREFLPVAALSGLGTCVAFLDIIDGKHALKRGSRLFVAGGLLGSAIYGTLQWFKTPSRPSTTDDTFALARTAGK